MYSFVGNSPGQAYFVLDGTTGEIHLRTSLLQDSARQYTLHATVSDSAKPARYAVHTATVEVAVIRNRYTPDFLNVPYSTYIAESLSLATSVFQVTAVDRDQLVNTSLHFYVTYNNNYPFEAKNLEISF